MRLLSCYIEGYGQLKQREYTFNEGITTFAQENGAGKTTLASFIKAMFYGLKGYRKSSTEFCDREHFYPFDGGLFGGNLTFEMGGRVYKIERFFGEKSETTDTVRVYENGVITTALGEDIGRSVFGVDKESFERTIFIDGGDIEMKSTSVIHAQLNRFLEGGEDDGGLDDALSALDKAAKVYKKSKAGNDKVSQTAQRVALLNEAIDNATSIKRALENKYDRAQALQRQIEALNGKIVEGQTANERRSQMEHYDSLLEQVARDKKALETLWIRYPLGLPSEEETLAVNAYMGTLNELSARADGVKFSKEDEGRLALLSVGFSTGLPDEKTLLAAEKKVEKYVDIDAKLSALNGRAIGRRENELKGKFSVNRPTQEKMAWARGQEEKYRQAKAEYDRTPAWAQEKGRGRSKKGYAVWAVLAALLCVAGGVGLLWNKLVGIIALAVGGVSLLADAFAYLNKKSNPVSAENPAKERLAEEMKEAELALQSVLLPCGYYSGKGVEYDFSILENDLQELAAIEADELARGRELAMIEAEKASLQTELTAFFRGYALSGDAFVKLLADLRVRARDFADLTARRTAAEQGVSTIERERAELLAKVEAYRKKYGLKELICGEILQDIRAEKRLRASIAEREGQAESYRKARGLQASGEIAKVDLAALQWELTEKQSEKSRLDREIAADETEAEKLEGYEAEKAESDELLKGYKRKHKLLTSAAELLKTAEGRLRDKYVRPVREVFLRYAEPIERALGEKVVVTKDFELRFERNGIERSEKHLSAGQRSICALCFRLALIKNMYEGQLPFLVLDDPFASLDEGHMQRVAALLKELSKEMQTVYFTCHESRKI